MHALSLNQSTKNKETSLESTLATIMCILVYKTSISYEKSDRFYTLICEVKDCQNRKRISGEDNKWEFPFLGNLRM